VRSSMALAVCVCDGRAASLSAPEARRDDAVCRRAFSIFIRVLFGGKSAKTDSDPRRINATTFINSVDIP